MFAWLLNRASRVYQWFGNSYSGWISKLKNFWTHLRYYRDQAVKWAKNWALPKIISYWQDAKSRIYNAKWEAINWAANQIKIVNDFLQPKIQAVKNLLGLRVLELSAEDQRMRAKIHKGDSRVETEVKTWAEVLFGRLLSPFKWILELRDLLEALKELFTEENLKKLVTIFNTLFSFILTFVTNPLGVILGIIEPIFLELLGFVLGYAFAGERYQLPPWPDWVAGYGGGSLTGFDPPGAAKRNLGKPLKSLYISGWPFKEGHRGLDLGLKMNEPVFAMHSGTVQYINRAYSGYGFQVVLSGGPWWTRYAHLNKLGVSKDQAVSKGQVIGLGDTTGNSTGPHLHLEIKYNGKFVDPEDILF